MKTLAETNRDFIISIVIYLIVLSAIVFYVHY